MPSRTAAIVFEQEFLPIRAKLLEVAASLDRLDRAGGPPPDGPRMGQIREAIEVLLHRDNNRVEQIQLAFSLPYDDHWREKFKMTKDE
jgi:hypothetical protein